MLHTRRLSPDCSPRASFDDAQPMVEAILETVGEAGWRNAE